jgi:Na+/phosphate symporter
MLKGRGHDATEFQEAQSALGLTYSGHFLDWFFLILFILGAIIWIIKARPSYQILGRLILGVILTAIFLIELQTLNNAIFDPIFQSK